MMFAVIVGAVLLAIFFFKIHKDYVILAFARRIKTVNGAEIDTIATIEPGKTIFGNNFDLLSMNPGQIFNFFRENAAKYKRSYIQYFVATPIYNVITAEEGDIILNDKRLIAKGTIFRFLKPLIRNGLLISTDSKWHSRRKMLSPAFHFNILEQFLEIFKEESDKFVNLLDKNDDKVISLTDLIPRLTLNAVCETAMGVKLDHMTEGDTYREYLKDIETAMMKRILNPMYMSEFLWETFGNTNKFRESYDGVHRFTSDIIKKRRGMFAELKSSQKSAPTSDGDNIFMSSKKQRYAMLDTLLLAEKDGFIDHVGICEEVDTFVFGGFDTTSMSLIYAIMNLSLYPKIQQQCFEEIKSLIDDDLTKLTIPEVNKLQCLDRFLKESLRLYPSVPIITREAEHDTALSNNILLPKGSQIYLHLYDILRDPKQFKNPNDFDPDRFLPEKASDRHPFAYVPFSAGSRNCIGQKMATFEMKTVLIYMIKNFEIQPDGSPMNLVFNQGFLLRSSQNIKVRVVKRIQK